LYLSYTGIRVTNIEKSLEFYTKLLGLEEVARGDNSAIGGGTYVLLRDKNSGQKLELNYYPEGSPYASNYLPGEGLDHISFRVNNVAEIQRLLQDRGVEKVDLISSLQEVQTAQSSFHVGYMRDPDGNWIEFYDHPQRVDYSKISDGY